MLFLTDISRVMNTRIFFLVIEIEFRVPAVTYLESDSYKYDGGLINSHVEF